MVSYNVFFSPKAGVAEGDVIASAKGFLGQLQARGKVRSYRILRVVNPASFAGLPRFQAIVDYSSQADMDESFAQMREPGKVSEGIHGRLTHLVTDFRVSFTDDA